MKRFLSLILSLTVLASIFSIGASVFAEKTNASKHNSFCFLKNSDGSCDSSGIHFAVGKVKREGNRFVRGKNKFGRPNKFNVSSDAAWEKEIKASSDGNRFARGRNRFSRPNKFNVSSDGAWEKEFKVPSDGNRFARGKNKFGRPNKFNVSSDAAWEKEFKVSSDGNKFPQRKAKGNRFPVKKQSPSNNKSFPWHKSNMNIFEKNEEI